MTIKEMFEQYVGAGASDKRKEKCKNRCNNEAASGIKMLRLVANL